MIDGTERGSNALDLLRGRGNSEHELARERRSCSKSKHMLGTVAVLEEDAERQEQLYQEVKASLEPGMFFPGDAFIKGLDGVTNDIVLLEGPLTTDGQSPAIRPKVGLAIQLGDKFRSGMLIVNTNCCPSYQPAQPLVKGACQEIQLHIPLHPVPASKGYHSRVDCSNPYSQGNQGPIGVTTTGIPLYNHWALPSPVGECTQEELLYKYSKLPGRARQLYSLDPVFGRTFDSMGGAFGSGAEQVGAAMAVDALQKMVRNGEHSGIIGYALDGYPIYGPIGYVDGEAQVMRSSYVQGNYLRFGGDLDMCNGIFGPTPEYPLGVYHYHMTIEVHGDEAGAEIKRDIYGKNQGGVVPAFPYIIGYFHGVPQGLGVTPGPASTEQRKYAEDEMMTQQVKILRAKRVAREALDRYKLEREILQEISREQGIEHTTPLRLRPY